MMNTSTSKARIMGLAMATSAMVALAGPAGASAAWVMDLPAGLACADFDLRVEGAGDANRVVHEWTDEDGNVVRTITAGTGDSLTYINLATGKTYSSRSNGAVDKSSINPDGSSTKVLTGHNVVIMYPSDIPAGPSTTLYTGRVTITIDSAGTWTLVQATGRGLDICAAVS
jgi:hypothetical protein